MRENRAEQAQAIVFDTRMDGHIVEPATTCIPLAVLGVKPQEYEPIKTKTEGLPHTLCAVALSQSGARLSTVA